jgi:uncharacterized membrane protein YccF (DUF307 family)
MQWSTNPESSDSPTGRASSPRRDEELGSTGAVGFGTTSFRVSLAPYGEKGDLVKTILNIVWLLLAGLWLAFGYLLAALLLAITIVGLPFAKQALKLAHYALWPFGRTLIQSPERNKSVSIVANILWFVLAGWWLALAHLITGCLLCLTVIGIPLGVADLKMAGAALVPFGREVVRTRDLVVARRP